ncbi:MAG: hypothetical protein CFE24_07825 [Flavobacterium sp. BFFFF2]|nr:MAG: hypothetical protein CFE24_07825 [Flavobacterium sp. BFFFF2]
MKSKFKIILILVPIVIIVLNFTGVVNLFVNVETQFDNAETKKSSKNHLKIYFMSGFKNNVLVYFDGKFASKTFIVENSSAGYSNFYLDCEFKNRNKKRLVIVMDSYKKLDVIIDCKYDYLYIHNSKSLKWNLLYSNTLYTGE